MEHFYNKVSHLEKLWSDLGTSLDSSTIADKLKQVLHELDTVIQYEEWRKHLLSADIEDLMASIEKGCEITGITIESLLMKANKNEQENYWDYYINGFTNLIEPTLERKKYLKNLNNRLYKEIQQRKYHVKKWIKNINQLCQQLEINSPFDHYTEYYNKLNWATVQKISCTLRDLNQKYQTNKAHFEHYMYAIDYYWNILGIQEQDQKEPMDMAIYKYIKELNLSQEFDIDQKPTLSSSSLFIASYGESDDNSNEVASNSAYLYYQPSLPFPLSLSDSFIMSLQQKVHDLELLFDHRRDLYHKYVNNLHEIWVELRIPDARKCTIHKSYKEDNLIKLQTNYDEMKNIVRILMEEYIETIQDKLTNLWDECLFTQKERDNFMEDLYERSNTMDDLHLILDRHLEYLDRIVPTSKLVAKIMKQRKELIQKMIAFETSASDPKRLFRASFQLIEEERWRKTCFPTLLELDDALIKAVKKFERISEKHFMVGDRRYLDILLDEIADRAANQTFFGFLNTEPTEERPVRIKSKSKSLYTYSSPTNVKYDKRVKI